MKLEANPATCKKSKVRRGGGTEWCKFGLHDAVEESSTCKVYDEFLM